MFETWREYRDYLLQYICLDESQRQKFRNKFEKMDLKYRLFPDQDKMVRVCIKAILSNDYHMTQIDNWFANQHFCDWRNWMNGKTHRNNDKNPYIILARKKGINPIPLKMPA